MAEASPAGDDPGPGLVEAVRRSPVLVVAVVVLGALLGLAFTLVRGSDYTARAQLVVGTDSDVTLFASGAPSQPAARAQAAAVALRTHEVAKSASELLGGRISTAKVERAITVAPSTDSAVVTVGARSDDADEAAQIANAVAKAYEKTTNTQAEQTGQRAQAVLARQEERLQARVAEVKKEQATRAAEVAKRYSGSEPDVSARLTQLTLNTDPEYQSLVNRQDRLSDTLSALNESQSQNLIDTQLVTGGVSTLYPAAVPGGSQQQTLVRNALIGAVLGLLLGTVLAWRRLDRAAGTVPTRSDRRRRRQAPADDDAT